MVGIFTVRCPLEAKCRAKALAARALSGCLAAGLPDEPGLSLTNGCRGTPDISSAPAAGLQKPLLRRLPGTLHTYLHLARILSTLHAPRSTAISPALPFLVVAPSCPAPSACRNTAETSEAAQSAAIHHRARACVFVPRPVFSTLTTAVDRPPTNPPIFSFDIAPPRLATSRVQSSPAACKLPP
jgi:hypothetical protein